MVYIYIYKGMVALHSASTSSLYDLLSSGLDRDKDHRDERRQNQSPGGINRRNGVLTGIDTDNRGHETSDTIEAASDTGSGASIRGREDLGGVSVENAVHHHLEEGLERRAHQLHVCVLGGCEAEE